MMYQDKVLDAIEDMGLFIKREDEEDINLQEYIIDSLQFISFIIELEKAFNIEFPDELLLYDNIQSLNGLSTLIENIVELQ